MNDIIVEKIEEPTEEDLARLIVKHLQLDDSMLTMYAAERQSLIRSTVDAVQRRNFRRIERLLQSWREWIEQEKINIAHVENANMLLECFFELYGGASSGDAP